MGQQQRWYQMFSWARRFSLKQLDFALISLNLALCYIEFLFPYANPPLIEGNRLLVDVSFHAIFLCLSRLTPSLQQPIWKRRLYVLVCLGTVILGVLFFSHYELILYWWILKGCLILPLAEMSLVIGGIGIAYIMSLNLTLGKMMDAAMVRCADYRLPPDYMCKKIDRSGILFDNMTFFIGASAFAIFGGYLLKSEQASRQKSERLSQEIQSLSTQLERDRLARDIHDLIGHQLTTLGVQLQLAQRLQTRSPHEAEQAIQCATQLNHDCLQSLRTMLHSLQKDPINFAQSVQVLLQQMEQSSSFLVNYRVDLPPLPPQMSHQLYCIVQEVFTNIQKHAQATRVDFTSWMSPDSLWLEIRDNGIGFDVDQPYSGFGLRGIQERILILGGRLAIASNSKDGTEILVVIPAQGAA